jgi:hypothetical protein
VSADPEDDDRDGGIARRHIRPGDGGDTIEAKSEPRTDATADDRAMLSSTGTFSGSR